MVPIHPSIVKHLSPETVALRGMQCVQAMIRRMIPPDPLRGRRMVNWRMVKPKDSLPETLVSQIVSIHPVGMTERLVQHLTSWVMHRHIQPGNKLPAERDLAAMLRVSRGSVRRALKALEAMGAIEVRHGSGAYLTNTAAQLFLQPKHLRMPLQGISFGELYEARRAVEAEATAVAASRATKREVAGLQQEIKRMHQHLADPMTYLKHDLAFHHKIMLAAGNSVFVWFQELAVTMISGALQARAQTVSLNNTFIEHQAILEAIAAKDPDAARAAMLEHLVLARFYAHEQTLIALHLTASGAVQRGRSA
jgi:GntR family transcriptional regulator, transcriptional repressor for pyruvate dehydrogenase complex